MSERVVKMNELIRQEIARLLEQEIEWPKNCLVTVVKVITSRDLKSAKIFLSIFPDNLSGTALHLIRKSTKQLRELLAEELTIFTTPRLNFFIDSTERQAAKIDEVIDNLKNER
ncbi:MAG: 30S ribosome-binding factor RbfA [Candidatus Buchananbacteria bacterium]